MDIRQSELALTCHGTGPIATTCSVAALTRQNDNWLHLDDAQADRITVQFNLQIWDSYLAVGPD